MHTGKGDAGLLVENESCELMTGRLAPPAQGYHNHLTYLTLHTQYSSTKIRSETWDMGK